MDRPTERNERLTEKVVELLRKAAQGEETDKNLRHFSRRLGGMLPRRDLRYVIALIQTHCARALNYGDLSREQWEAYARGALDLANAVLLELDRLNERDEALIAARDNRWLPALELLALHPLASEFEAQFGTDIVSSLMTHGLIDVVQGLSTRRYTPSNHNTYVLKELRAWKGAFEPK